MTMGRPPQLTPEVRDRMIEELRDELLQAQIKFDKDLNELKAKYDKDKAAIREERRLVLGQLQYLLKQKIAAEFYLKNKDKISERLKEKRDEPKQ